MAFFGPPPQFVGATTASGGRAGLVPAPSAGSGYRFLSSNGTFSQPLMMPAYKNTADFIGSFLAAAGTSFSISATATASRRFFNWIFLPEDGNINALAFRTGSAVASPTMNINVALWQVGDDGLPSSYIIGASADIGGSTSTDVSISCTPTFVPLGLYYISVTSSGTSTGNVLTYQLVQSQAFIRRSIGIDNLNTANGKGFFYDCLTSFDQTTHESFSISATLAPPLCGVKYQ